MKLTPSLEEGGLVYSTNPQTMAALFQQSRLNDLDPKPSGNKKIVKIRLEKSGRSGKAATVLYDMYLGGERADTLCQRLKKKLGCGGSYINEEIILQGDLREKIRAFLVAEGFRVIGQ
ncbi:MAG: translation initiation factor [Flavobacteriales bacterium]|nr:translation initiation factor [Flavobacteriales bacterium]